MLFKRNRSSAAVVENVANPPVFNPNHEQTLDFAEYRADAIARCLEQLREESKGRHYEHDHLVAEAMSYGWVLVGAHRWTRDDLYELDHRLHGTQV